jgi:hypothetical protein
VKIQPGIIKPGPIGLSVIAYVERLDFDPMDHPEIKSIGLIWPFWKPII